MKIMQRKLEDGFELDTKDSLKYCECIIFEKLRKSA